MNIRPLTENCERILQKKEHVCIGVSPFNSLFSEEYLTELAYWGKENFKSFHFFLPDEPTFYTLEALGYDEVEARKKMKKQLNWLRNKISKALAAVGEKNDSRLVDWNFLTANEVFRSELDTVFQLFDGDTEFRAHCLGASEWVLQSKLSPEEMTEQRLYKAVKYFLSEIPLFASANRILDQESSIFCYHQSIVFHDRLYTHNLAQKPSAGQGYGVLEH